MLRIQCRCGEIFHASEQHLGRRLRCRCGRTVTVKVPARERVASVGTRASAWVQGLASRWKPAARSGASLHGHGARTGAAQRGRGGAGVRAAAAPRVRIPPQLARVEPWLGWITLGYFALVLVAWFALWRLSDVWWPATALLFGPRWMLLLPLALLVPAALLMRRVLLAPLAVTALIVLMPVMGLRTGWGGMWVGDRGSTDLRVVTLNAEDNPGAILRLLSHADTWEADIVAIQECGNAIETVGVYMVDWHTEGDQWLCLLSRFPIKSVETMMWEDLEGVRDAGIGGSSMAKRYVLQTPQRDLHLVNIHLETARKGLERLRYQLERMPVKDNMLMREVESRRAFRWLGHRHAALIVAGDFNMPIESAIYRESWSSFQNAFTQVGRGFGKTKDNGIIRLRIDHVLSGRNWQPVRAWVGPDVGSDHMPVIADLRWVGPEN
jgi:vancomycin resistance protein VanJ